MITRRAVLAAPAMTFLQQPAEAAIIPLPSRVVRRTGQFIIGNQTRITEAPGAQIEAKWLSSILDCPVEKPSPRGSTVSLTLDASLSSLGPEGYTLDISPTHAALKAPKSAGLYYAAQTLRQLLPPSACGKTGRGAVDWSVPCLQIEDSPRFPWRGGHIDTCRHFLPKDEVLKYIDALALHKFNTLHFHLTDDQGWRIEIKKYPKLTTVGSRRRETRVGHEDMPQGFDGKPYGGFYSQADIREIVAYAAARHINVVPEIEMPGHAQAALSAYPEFGNTGEKLEVWTQWGVSNNTFNVSDKAIAFLQDVLSEVLELFPSKYIHVGGDEVPPDQWKANPEAQARIKALGLKNESALHSWFIGRMNEFLRSRGRILVGWDEIIEGGHLPGAVVMSWRGEKGGIEAARYGNQVVMTPDNYTYFNYYQSKGPKEPLAIGGFIPLDMVYNYDPVPAALNADQARLVLGTQGQLWSEYIPTPQILEYMAFPRMCALAEVAWTPKGQKNYASFQQRLRTHLERLKAMGINYRPLEA